MTRQNQRRRRSASDLSSAGPSTAPADPIPLNVLQQSCVQNSSAESSNLSSSQSPSTTPPSSAEHVPRQEQWPSLGSDGTTRPANPSPEPPRSQTEPREERAEQQTHLPSLEHGGNGNQATQAPQQEDLGVDQKLPSSRIGRWASERSWFHSTLGVTSLIVTMVSVFFYGIRSYEIALYSARINFKQTCASLLQVNRSGGPECERGLSEDPTPPPYFKRGILYKPGVEAYKLTKRATSAFSNAPPVTNYGIGLFGIGVFAVFLAFVVAWGILAIKDREFGGGANRPEEELVFTSPVRSEGIVEITRHHPEGSETVEPEGPVQITTCKPPVDNGLGEVRRRILSDRLRRLGSGSGDEEGLPGETNLNSSDDTLVAAWTESNSKKVSIATGSNAGLHDGLIELKPTESTKNFLDPDTGASYHLSPWKSTHSDDEDDALSLNSKPKAVGAVKDAIVKMSVGGAALANGKAIEDQVGDAIQEKEHIAQQAGDSLAGEVTNDTS